MNLASVKLWMEMLHACQKYTTDRFEIGGKSYSGACDLTAEVDEVAIVKYMFHAFPGTILCHPFTKKRYIALE